MIARLRLPPIRARQRDYRAALRWLRVAGVPVLLFVLVARFDAGSLWLTAQAANWSLLLLATACQIAYGFLLSERWRWLLQSLDVNETAGATYRATLRGCYYGQFLPTSLGGDVAKTALLTGHGHEPLAVAGATVVDRVLGLLTIAVAGLACLPLSGLHYGRGAQIFAAPPIAVALAAVMLGAAGAAGILLARTSVTEGDSSRRRRQVSNRRAEAILRGLSRIRQPKALLVAFGLSIVGHLLLIFATELTFASFGQSVSLFAIGWVLLVSSLGQMLPITVNGLGIREAAFAVVLAPIGVTALSSVSTGLAAYVASVLQAGAGAMLEVFGPLVARPLAVPALSSDGAAAAAMDARGLVSLQAE